MYRYGKAIVVGLIGVLIPAMGSTCGAAPGVESLGCATRVSPPDFDFQLTVPCGYAPDNSHFTPVGNELFIQAFLKQPVDGTNILVAVVPPNNGSALDPEFNTYTETGPFTSSFDVALETAENINTRQNLRQFFAAVQLPDGNILIIGLTGFIGDAATNKNTAQLMFRSVKIPK